MDTNLILPGDQMPSPWWADEIKVTPWWHDTPVLAQPLQQGAWYLPEAQADPLAYLTQERVIQVRSIVLPVIVIGILGAVLLLVHGKD